MLIAPYDKNILTKNCLTFFFLYCHDLTTSYLQRDKRQRQFFLTQICIHSYCYQLQDEPRLLCERCGRQGKAVSFYGKKKQYCSFSCSRPSVVAKKIQQKKNVRLPGKYTSRWITFREFLGPRFLLGTSTNYAKIMNLRAAYWTIQLD